MATENAIYRFEYNSELVEVVGTPDPFAAGDPDCKTVVIENLEDGERHSIFADNFRSDYEFVADSREDL